MRRLLSLIPLAALLLAGCDGEIVNRPRGNTRPTNAAASTPAPQIASTPEPAQAAPSGGATPCPNGVVPPPTPVLIWCEAGPGCEPTPEYRTAKYPCATNQEIDNWLQGGK